MIRTDSVPIIAGCRASGAAPAVHVDSEERSPVARVQRRVVLLRCDLHVVDGPPQQGAEVGGGLKRVREGPGRARRGRQLNRLRRRREGPLDDRQPPAQARCSQDDVLQSAGCATVS